MVTECRIVRFGDPIAVVNDIRSSEPGELLGVTSAVEPGTGHRPEPDSSSSDAGSVSGRIYGGLTVAERRAVRRQRLVDTGLDLFASTGYAATTIEGICARAGVTARHFYEEFSSREELLEAVFDEAMAAITREIIESLDDASIDPNDLTSRVRTGVSALVHAFLDDPRRARVACVEVVGVSPAMEAHRRTALHGFARILESEATRMVEQGIIQRGDFTLTIRAMIGATYELFVDWCLETPRPSLGSLISVLTGLFLAVVSYR